MSGIETPQAKASPKASSVPPSSSPMAGVSRRTPSVRIELKKPGPTCNPRA